MWQQLLREGRTLEAGALVGVQLGPAARRARLDEHKSRQAQHRGERRRQLRESSTPAHDHRGIRLSDPMDYYLSGTSSSRAA